MEGAYLPREASAKAVQSTSEPFPRPNASSSRITVERQFTTVPNTSKTSATGPGVTSRGLRGLEQPHVSEHGLYALFVCRREGGAANGRGDGHSEPPHRQLYGAHGRVAVRAEDDEVEDPAVQLCRPRQVAALGRLDEADEKPGGDVGEGADGAVGPSEEGG